MDTDISHAVQDALDALSERVDKLEVAAGLAITTDIGEGDSPAEPKEGDDAEPPAVAGYRSRSRRSASDAVSDTSEGGTA